MSWDWDKLKQNQQGTDDTGFATEIGELVCLTFVDWM